MVAHIEEGRWWVSPYNFESGVLDEFDFAQKVEIHDATLRDGEQTPGVVFRKEDKVEIAKMLDAVGIERIEAGMPAVSEEDRDAIMEISKLGLNAKIFTFARALKVDIDMALDCGADGVVIEVPIGYPKLKYQFGWTWEDVLKKSIDSINYAREKKLHALFFPYDTTRALKEDLISLLKGIMQQCPPDSIGVVDTMGCALPEAMKHMVRLVKRQTGLPVEVHTHNDFGMGVATELAGVTVGAAAIHSCVNGLGERTGNAALEELIIGLQMLLGINKHYDLHALMDLCTLVAKIAKITPARNKPVIGTGNYIRESGIGVDMVMKKPLAMFATAPQTFKREGEVVLGKKSGKASIEYKLGQMGISGMDDEKIKKILAIVKSEGTRKRDLLTDAEFRRILDTI